MRQFKLRSKNWKERSKNDSTLEIFKYNDEIHAFKKLIYG